jgi:glutamate-1-semialdehyde 2,1-aminomutase
VVTAENFGLMEARAAQLEQGILAAFARHRIAWQVSRVGARLEFVRSPAPRTGRQSMEALDHDLEHAMHLYLLNRGFLLTPFHNMMLASPATTAAQVDAFLAVFDGALAVLGERLRQTRVGQA